MAPETFVWIFEPAGVIKCLFMGKNYGTASLKKKIPLLYSGYLMHAASLLTTASGMEMQSIAQEQALH